MRHAVHLHAATLSADNPVNMSFAFSVIFAKVSQLFLQQVSLLHQPLVSLMQGCVVLVLQHTTHGSGPLHLALQGSLQSTADHTQWSAPRDH